MNRGLRREEKMTEGEIGNLPILRLRMAARERATPAKKGGKGLGRYKDGIKCCVAR